MGGFAAARAKAALMASTGIFTVALGLWSVAVFQTSEASSQADGIESGLSNPSTSLPAATLAGGQLTVRPITGLAPLAITVECTAAGTVLADFGDSSDIVASTCPATLGHRYLTPGRYTLEFTQGGASLGTQVIAVTSSSAATQADSLSPGQLLVLSLLGASVLSMLVSYLIIRPPVGKHAW